MIRKYFERDHQAVLEPLNNMMFDRADRLRGHHGENAQSARPEQFGLE